MRDESNFKFECAISNHRFCEADAIFILHPSSFILSIIPAEFDPEIAQLVLLVHAFVASRDFGLFEYMALQPDVGGYCHADLEVAAKRAAVSQNLQPDSRCVHVNPCETTARHGIINLPPRQHAPAYDVIVLA